MFEVFIKVGKVVFYIEYFKGVLKLVSVKFKVIIFGVKGVERFIILFKIMDFDGWVEYCDGK